MSAIELVCFHHAGGGATSFNPLRRALSAVGASVRLTAVELPGRGARRDEPRFVDASDCARSIANELADLLSGPHILLGHSMGALLAYLVAHQRIMVGLTQPQAVIAAAACAPHLTGQQYDLDAMDDHEIALELASHGGLPVDVLAHPDWLSQLIPTVRDDLRICQSHRWSDDLPLPCSLHIFGAYSDPIVPPDALAAWADYSVAPQPVRLFSGGHFLFRRPAPELVSAVADIGNGGFQGQELVS